MLNLDELERSLDNALNNETPESLKQWLEKQRIDSILDIFGDGHIDTLETQSVCFKQTRPVVSNVKTNSGSISNNDYCLAA